MEKEVIKVPREYKRRGVRLLGANKQVIARRDNELGRTKTDKMKIDAGEHLPLKLRRYSI